MLSKVPAIRRGAAPAFNKPGACSTVGATPGSEQHNTEIAAASQKVFLLVVPASGSLLVTAVVFSAFGLLMDVYRRTGCSGPR